MGQKPLKSALWILFFFLLDQGTKLLSLSFIDVSFEISGIFRLLVVHNTGIAFSLPFSGPLLLILTGGVIAYGLWYFFHLQKKTLFQYWGGILFLAGAFGNFFDRVFRGAVVDFLSFGSFPVFNIADICISVGVGLLLLDELRKTR